MSSLSTVSTVHSQLLIVHEGQLARHQYFRQRSARWLHRLEVVSALHWVSLAVAVAWPDGTFGPPPPFQGILLGLPAACLVAITCLEQLPGDATSDSRLLLRGAARASQPGDLQHLISSNAWYRGLLDLLVIDPERLASGPALGRAQGNLPWWLRPPLLDAQALRGGGGISRALPPQRKRLGSQLGTHSEYVSLHAFTGSQASRTDNLSGIGMGSGDAAAPAMGRSSSFDIFARLKPPSAGLRSSSFGLPGLLFPGGGGGNPGLRRDESELLMALARPVSGISDRVWAALPSSLSEVLREVCEVGFDASKCSLLTLLVQTQNSCALPLHCFCVVSALGTLFD